MRQICINVFVIFTLFFSTSLLQAAYKLQVNPRPNPPDVGDNILEIELRDENGKEVSEAKIDLLISMPAMGTMPRMEEKAVVKSSGQGRYLAEYTLSMAGSWELTLTAKKETRSETFSYSLTTRVPGLVDKMAATQSLNQETPSENLISIAPDRLQKIGVRFSEAKITPLQKNLRAVGLVEADPSQKTDLVLRFSGYIKKLFKGKTGEYVKRGTPLFTVYSPELLTAQSEVFLTHEQGSSSLHNATLERLRSLGLSEKDISAIKNRGKPENEVVISAPESGSILEINVREGSSFAKGQTLYSVGNLKNSYITARVFLSDLKDLKEGQKVKILLPDDGSKVLNGKIDVIYPSIREGEGTANARIVAEPTPEMIPGLYVSLEFFIDFGPKLVIPTTAILYSGAHKYVFVDKGAGHFEPRELVTGKTNEELVEVKEGLQGGEKVATSGTFLLSSEAELRSALPKWNSKK